MLNPITHFTTRTLQRHRPTLRSRLLWMLPFLLVASIPLWAYIDDTRDNVLIFMIVMIGGAQIAVSLRTLLIASEANTQLDRMTGNLDLLILTGIEAQHLKRGQWWAILRTVWVDHALVAVLRVGLLIALAQFLHRMDTNNPAYGCYGGYSTLFCYVTPITESSNPFNPSLTQIGIGFVLTLIFGLLEGGLLTALALLIASIKQLHKQFAVPISVFIRATLLGVSLIGVLQLRVIYTEYFPYSYDPYCSSSGYLPVEECVRNNNIRHAAQLQQYTATAFVDNGTFLTVDLMRPVERAEDVFGLFTPDYGRLKSVVGLTLSLVMYVALIYIFLRGAQRLTIRRGFLSK